MLTTNQNLQQGRYRIVRQLGQNGAGSAYEAFDNTLGASVLLKEIDDNLGQNATPAQLEARKLNFAEKAKLLTGMKHQSLLGVKDFFSETDNHYLVTELTAGNSLGELLEKNKKPFPVTDVANWADGVLDALNYLHTLSPAVIHGEVKPQNVCLSANGEVRLRVFNLVKSEEEINAATANLTFDAAVLPFLPLEQIWSGLDAASKKVILTNYDDKSEKILEQPTDARSDVFSVAATFYYLLTARVPTDALTRSIDILEGKEDPLPSPSQLNSSVPQEISGVIMKALEIKREDRFSSAVIMRQVLRTAFTRLKESGANAAPLPPLEEDAMLEIPVDAPKPAAPALPKNPEMESEQARQLDLIKQQLREAEARRLEAENRAAEAEKRLQEAKKHTVAEPVAAAPVSDFVSNPKTNAAETINAAPKYESGSDEFSTLFAEPAKDGGGLKKAAAAAIALIVLSGGGFGIWKATQSKSGEPLPAVTTNNSALPAPTVEDIPNPAEATDQAATDPSEPADSSSADVDNPASNPAVVRSKPAVQTPTPQTAQVKKPAATPAKQSEQKKVTLDDLLKDN